MALVYTDVQAFYGEHEVSGEANTFTPDFMHEIKEHRPFAQGAVAKEPGIRGYGGTLEGVLTFSATGPGNDFWDDKGSKVPVSVHIGNNNPAVVGDLSLLINAVNAKLDYPITGGELLAYTLELPGDGFGGIGNVMAIGTKGATGSGAAQNLGAVAAGQTIIAAMHVTAKGGTTPTLDVIVESDDAEAFTMPTTRLTFAQIGDAIGYEFVQSKSSAGITDTWWRVSWTLTGGTPSYTLSVAFAIV